MISSKAKNINQIKLNDFTQHWLASQRQKSKTNNTMSP